jgi:Flp pilus assembly protein TadD
VRDTQQVTVLRVVITTLGLEQPALAAEYAQRLIHLTPDDPWAWMTLGLFQGLNHQAAAAKDALRKASALARKQGDPAMAREIDDLRQQISNPLFGLLGPMLQNFGPDLFEGFDEEDY